VRVTEAADGRSALAALAAAQRHGAPFDLMLLDQAMPEMSGADVARAMRDLPDGRQPAIVLASSMSEPLTNREAIELGIDAVTIKPVRYQALIDTLRQALGKAVEPGSSLAPAAEPGADEVLGGRVLLAEDNEINSMLARTILEQVGLVVTCVPNGALAVEAFTNHPFDLVLMDMHMPEIDGIEATRRIRRDEPAGQRTPIVAMTANAMQRDREVCHDAGMDDFVSKPINVQLFLTVVDRWLTIAPAAEESATAESQRA
jgi:CheY-like chemotaxis protein